MTTPERQPDPTVAFGDGGYQQAGAAVSRAGNTQQDSGPAGDTEQDAGPAGRYGADPDADGTADRPPAMDR